MENLDCDNGGSLGHTILLTSNSPRAMRSMTVNIDKRGTGHGVVTENGPALEVGVVGIDARVNQISIHPETSRCIERILLPVGGAVRDGSETPCRRALSRDALEQVDDADRFNGENLYNSKT